MVCILVRRHDVFCVPRVTKLYNVIVYVYSYVDLPIIQFHMHVGKDSQHANQVKLAWLSRYPLPYEVIIHREKKLLAKFKTMMAND